MKAIITTLTLALFLSACGQESDAPTPETNAPVEPDVSIYAAAVDSPSRLASDPERDAGRRPAEVLAFFGIKRGETVLEMFAGGGYYTELLASVVGEGGKVVAHMNTPLVQFGGDEYTARHADNRLPNVEVLMAENNELMLDADHFDAITIVLNYHDLYWSSDDYGWEKIDAPKFLAEIYKALKPGGTLGIVDHFAAPGSTHDTATALHRIDVHLVVAELESAGFVIDAESDVLRNMEDDHRKGVFDPTIRGKTDRFVLRFKKPE